MDYYIIVFTLVLGAEHGFAEKCQDKMPFLCESMYEQCTSYLHFNYLREICPYTCQQCKDDCKDNVACESIKRTGGCDRKKTKYDWSIITRWCPRTCGLCKGQNRVPKKKSKAQSAEMLKVFDELVKNGMNGMDKCGPDGDKKDADNKKKEEQRKKDEAKKKADEAKKKQEEAKKKKEMEDKRKAEEETKKKAEAKKKAEEEAKRKAEEEAKKRAEEDKKRDEEKKKAEEEAKRKNEEEKKKAEEEAKKKAEEEAKKKAEEEEAERKAEEEAKKKAEEEAERKAEEEKNKKELERKKEQEEEANRECPETAGDGKKVLTLPNFDQLIKNKGDWDIERTACVKGIKLKIKAKREDCYKAEGCLAVDVQVINDKSGKWDATGKIDFKVLNEDASKNVENDRVATFDQDSKILNEKELAPLEELADQSKGFIVDNTVQVEVDIKLTDVNSEDDKSKDEDIDDDMDVDTIDKTLWPEDTDDKGEKTCTNEKYPKLYDPHDGSFVCISNDYYNALKSGKLKW